MKPLYVKTLCACLLLGIAYAYGLRVASVAEWPQSKRPGSLFIVAGE